MKADERKQKRKAADNNKRNRSNTITMLFYVIGVFGTLAVGLFIIYLRSRG